MQRESEGIEVPDAKAQAEVTKAVGHNAAGVKGPCGGHAEGAGESEGMAGETAPHDPDAGDCGDKVRQLQRQLWAAAKRAPGRRFIDVDDYVGKRLKGLRVKRHGRNQRAGQAERWGREYFEHLGLHRLRGTMRYPGNHNSRQREPA